MAKYQVLGNGNISVGLDEYGQIYDLNFPFVGLENHTGGRFVHKIGAWCDNKFHWIDDGSWQIEFKSSMKSIERDRIIATNEDMQIRLEFTNEVYNEKNIFLREVKVTNLLDNPRTIKLFFNQQFEIYESHRGDTAFYDPDNNVVIHYKGRRIFLINAYNRNDDEYFNQHSIGLFGIEGKEGTFKDAEDGFLESNPIEHGLTDSVVGVYVDVPGNESKYIEYWICISKLMEEVYDLNSYVIKKTPAYLLSSTKNYWIAWSNKKQHDFKDLTPEQVHLFFTSLKVMRIHTDNTGAIVASIDSDLLKNGRDYYSYVWPRDGALTSVAFSRAGFNDTNEEIFDFFKETISREGYFLHKYRADRSIGSSWHPWLYKGKKELPIQFDETALVIVALWEDFKISRNVEFVESLYNPIVRAASEFLMKQIHPETGIIKPSYDLWEERFGSGTFTSCTVYGGLRAAAKFADLFGKKDQYKQFNEAAEKVKQAILTYHYKADGGYFIKTLLTEQDSVDGTQKVNDVIDSSTLYGLFKFQVLDLQDEKLQSMKRVLHERLHCQTSVGGYPRYEKDNYFKVNNTVEGNPWIITTLWFAQLEISLAKSLDELKNLKHYFDWVLKYSLSFGILPEQIHPESGSPVSATPLTWSHAEYVVTVMDYIQRYEELSKAK